MDELDYLYNIGAMMGNNSGYTPYYYGSGLPNVNVQAPNIGYIGSSAAGNIGGVRGGNIGSVGGAAAGNIGGVRSSGNIGNPFSGFGGSNGGVPYGTLGLGALQMPFAISALIKANKLKYPTYAMTPEMARSVREGNEMRNVGFTGSEYNAYNQQLGQDRATTFNRARELSGGNLASTMMAILNGQNVNARNQLAVQDAALRRQNIAQSNALNAETQNLANMNTALNIENVNRQKQAAAGLMQSSLGNLASGFNLAGGLGGLPLPI